MFPFAIVRYAEPSDPYPRYKNSVIRYGRAPQETFYLGRVTILGRLLMTSYWSICPPQPSLVTGEAMPAHLSLKCPAL
jgi:hypothetical protein